MKRNLHLTITFFVLSAFLMQALGKFLIYTDYIINKEYITNNLCINKEKPKLKCNGKCHLAKQLKKQDQKEQSTSNSKDKFEVVYFETKVTYCFNEKSVFHNSKKEQFHYLSTYIDRYTSSVFQPPKA